jgi:hypothetical protein
MAFVSNLTLKHFCKEMTWRTSSGLPDTGGLLWQSGLQPLARSLSAASAALYSETLRAICWTTQRRRRRESASACSTPDPAASLQQARTRSCCSDSSGGYRAAGCLLQLQRQCLHSSSTDGFASVALTLCSVRLAEVPTAEISAHLPIAACAARLALISCSPPRPSCPPPRV